MFLAFLPYIEDSFSPCPIQQCLIPEMLFFGSASHCITGVHYAISSVMFLLMLKNLMFYPSIRQPATAPRARNKMDSLIFLPDPVKAASGSGASLSARQASDIQETSVQEPEVEVEVENVERPVDLYKVKKKGVLLLEKSLYANSM